MSYLSDRLSLFSGEITCKQLIQNFLSSAIPNGNNAFVEVYGDEALGHADQIDTKIQNGTAGKLAGMVVSVKDLIAIKEHRVSASSKILDGYTSPFHATVVEKLLGEDAIIIGRTNCDEFGMGSSNENSFFGPVTHHINKTRVPGGSSGGAAVSVQEGSCHLALGSDTGGSVRQPASFCGLYGLKPTYSRLSRYGLLAYASSFDTIGLLGTDPEDLRLVLSVVSDRDEKDSTSSMAVTPANRELGQIAVIKQWMESDALQPEVREAFITSLDALKADGWSINEIDLPEVEYLLETYYILTTAEASSNLSRYDGFRYGYGESAKDAGSLEESYMNTRSIGFGQEVKRRIFLGTFVLSASYYDAFYTKAQKARAIIRKRTEEVLQANDLILSPVSPTTAFELGSRIGDPIQMYLADQFTVHASVCGLPAISVPVGKDSLGMPIGIQATANYFEDEKLLNFGKYLGNLSFK